MEMKDVAVDISDGIGFFPGIVCDVSRFGLGIKDLPKKIDVNAQKMTIVVTSKKEHFKMRVRPRWSLQDGMRKKLGIEISNAPWGWTEFVMEFEPVTNDDDVWGEIDL